VSDKLHNAPIYLALIQAQFNPIPNIAKYIADIQDQLRRQGFPLYEPHAMPRVVFSFTPDKAPQEPGFINVNVWHVTNEAKTAGYVITDKAITFHTTHYETRNEFIPKLIEGLQVVHQVVDLAHVSRLGVRYLDAVLPRGSDRVEQYIKERLHGVPFNDQARLQSSYAESIYETETGPVLTRGKLVQRVYRQSSLLGYPPDLDPLNLVPMSRFVLTEARDHAIIDTDHFVEDQMAMDFNAIQEQALNLHVTAKKIFKAAVTDYAINAWKENTLTQTGA
jgi:uncharacterized protein (TIGR04255 family)